MKIAIVGGGIGGLAAYHALRKYLPSSTTITLYECYPSSSSTTAVIGGGLGLALNGQRVIADLSPEGIAYIKARGFETSVFTFRNAKGQLLGRKISHKEGDFGQILIARATVHEVRRLVEWRLYLKMESWNIATW